MINFYSGSSEAVNSKRAIRDCIETALSNLETGEQLVDPIDVHTIIFHTTIGHKFDELLTEAKLICPKAKVVGCSAGGIISNDQVSEKLRALAIMAITGDAAQVKIESVGDVSAHQCKQVATNLATNLKSSMPEINMVQVFCDGIDADCTGIITGIESVLGEGVTIFGGTSANNLKSISSYQFVGSETFTNGMIMIGYGDPTLKAVCGVHHGSRRIGEVFEVTKSDCNIIQELDGKPAWPFFMEKLGVPADSTAMDVVPIGALAEDLPEELKAPYNNPQFLRVPLGNDNQSISLSNECKVGTKLSITERDEDLIFEGVDRLMANILKQASEINGELVVVFHEDCLARGRLMFDRVLKDEIITRIQKPLIADTNIPWLGLYGFGEFCPIGKKNSFHSYTTAVIALYRSKN